MIDSIQHQLDEVMQEIERLRAEAKGGVITPQDIGSIAGRYKPFECVEAMQAISAFLTENNQDFEVVSLQYPPQPRGFVVSISRGGNEAISTNGFHTGVLYKEIVYCNIHPYGLPLVMWLNDFDGEGFCVITPSKYQHLKIQN